MELLVTQLHHHSKAVSVSMEALDMRGQGDIGLCSYNEASSLTLCWVIGTATIKKKNVPMELTYHFQFCNTVGLGYTIINGLEKI